jgi:hypothetical protein
VAATCTLGDGGGSVASTLMIADGSSCGFAAVASPPAQLPILTTLNVTYQSFQLSLRFVVRFPF